MKHRGGRVRSCIPKGYGLTNPLDLSGYFAMVSNPSINGLIWFNSKKLKAKSGSVVVESSIMLRRKERSHFEARKADRCW